MKVTFDTKENLNHEREREFLALSGDERFRAFLRMVVEMSVFERKPRKREQHFVLTKDEL